MAGYTPAAENVAIAAIGAAATFISLHTGDPGTAGSSEVVGGTYARLATTWGTASGGSMNGTAVIINVPAGTTVSFWGVWTLATGGVFHYGGAVPQAETFVGAGSYQATPTLSASN